MILTRCRKICVLCLILPAICTAAPQNFQPLTHILFPINGPRVKLSTYAAFSKDDAFTKSFWGVTRHVHGHKCWFLGYRVVGIQTAPTHTHSLLHFALPCSASASAIFCIELSISFFFYESSFFYIKINSRGF